MWKQLSSILFGDTMVPNIDLDYILLLGYSFYIRDIILPGSTTKKNTTQLFFLGFRVWGLV